MKDETMLLTLGPKASFRDLGEEGIVLMGDSGQLYSTSETGSAFLSAIQKGLSFDQAVDHILEQYDVDRQTLTDDLTGLVDYLVAEDVLVVKK